MLLKSISQVGEHFKSVCAHNAYVNFSAIDVFLHNGIGLDVVVDECNALL